MSALRAIVLGLLAGGACAHGPAARTEAARLGESHPAYRGAPFYLVAETGARVTRPTSASTSAGARALLTAADDAEVRALLAGADADIAALGDHAAPETLTALELTASRLATLLGAYTDLTAELDELSTLVAELPRLPSGRLPLARARMNELVDLIRLQLLAGR